MVAPPFSGSRNSRRKWSYLAHVPHKFDAVHVSILSCPRDKSGHQAGTPQLWAILMGASPRAASGVVRKRPLKVQAQRDLACPVPSEFGRLRRLQHPERARIAHVRRRRREVGMFKAFVNVASKRSRTPSRSVACLASPRFTAMVPGPSRIPTPALPTRAAPTAVGAKAPRLK